MFTLLMFIVITFFLIFKLREILGVRVGFYTSKENLKDFTTVEEVNKIVLNETEEKILQLSKYFPRFQKDDFIEKSKKVFEIVFAAYSNGDISGLQNLLAPKIFRAFDMAINDRKQKKETLEGIFIRFISTEITDVDILEKNVLITIKIVTEQSNVLKSEDGSIIEGNVEFVEKRTNIWVFFKEKASDDQSWLLYEIKDEQEK